MKVCDLVKAKPGNSLRCGSGPYPYAVIIKLKPFILASDTGDMIWYNQTPEDVTPTGNSLSKLVVNNIIIARLPTSVITEFCNYCREDTISIDHDGGDCFVCGLSKPTPESLKKENLLHKLLCKCGLHKWIELGNNIMLTDSVQQCTRCKLGKHDINFGTGMFTYTPEAMKKAWDDGKIDNPGAFQEIYGS